MANTPLLRRQADLIVRWIEDEGLCTATFVDVGCGDGAHMQRFAALGMSGIGLDLSAEAVAAVRARNLPGVSAVTDDFLTFEAQVDVVFMLNVLEHVREDSAYIERARSVLVPGGHLVAAVPLDPRRYRYADRNAGHLRRYARPEIRAKLRQGGFTIREELNIGFPVCNLYTAAYNMLCRARPLAGSKSHRSGIEGAGDYHPPSVERVVRLTAPALSWLIRMDRVTLRLPLAIEAVYICCRN